MRITPGFLLRFALFYKRHEASSDTSLVRVSFLHNVSVIIFHSRGNDSGVLAVPLNQTCAYRTDIPVMDHVRLSRASGTTIVLIIVFFSCSFSSQLAVNVFTA